MEGFALRGHQTVRLLAALLLTGCSSSGLPSSPPTVPTNSRTAFVVTGDFETGSYAVLPIQDPRAAAVDLGAVHGDAVARTYENQIYVVNRFGADNIQRIDPQQNWETVFQCSVGNGSNPHDIAFASPRKAYVSRYEESSVAIVDPSVGPDCEGFWIGEIDLSSFADADGIPEMDQMVIVNGLLFVALQRLNRNLFFEPTDASFLVVIDTATDQPIDTRPNTPAIDPIELTWTNPLGAGKGLPLDPATGDILVVQVGSFATIGDGGVETIAPTTFARSRILITEEDLGLNITDFVAVDGRNAWAIAVDEHFLNQVVQIDMNLREIVQTPLRSETILTDMEFEPQSGSIWLSDRSFDNAGVRVFQASDGAGIENPPFTTGLPPVDIVFLEPESED